jgi:hypothetical protein
MVLAILSVAVFLVLIVCRFVLTGLRRRPLIRQIGAPQQRENNVFEGRVGMVVIANNRFERSLDGVDLMDREDRAETYLRRIIALTGATQMSNYCVLDAGKTRFHVYDRNVERLRDLTDPTCAPEQTCFYLAHQDMPAAERIATALLQLKNNPELFDSWVDKRAAFKADGHVFSFSRVQ